MFFKLKLETNFAVVVGVSVEAVLCTENDNQSMANSVHGFISVEIFLTYRLVTSLTCTLNLPCKRFFVDSNSDTFIVINKLINLIFGSPFRFSFTENSTAYQARFEENTSNTSDSIKTERKIWQRLWTRDYFNHRTMKACSFRNIFRK